MRNTCKILVGKPAGRRQLGRTRHRWEDNIRMVLWEVGWEFVKRVTLTQDRNMWWALVNKIMNF